MVLGVHCFVKRFMDVLFKVLVSGWGSVGGRKWREQAKEQSMVQYC
jgi:hypothetical protein